MLACSSCVPVVAQAPAQCEVVSGAAQTPKHFTPSRKMLLLFMFSLKSSPPTGCECEDLCASGIPWAAECWKSALGDAGNATESSTSGEVVLVALRVGLPSLQGEAESNLKSCPRRVQLKLLEEDDHVLLEHLLY